MAEAARLVKRTPPAIAYHVNQTKRIRSRSRKEGKRTVRLVALDDVREVYGGHAAPGSASPDSADEDVKMELAVLRAELAGVRAHLEDVRNERDRLLGLLERMREPGT